MDEDLGSRESCRQTLQLVWERYLIVMTKFFFIFSRKNRLRYDNTVETVKWKTPETCKYSSMRVPEQRSGSVGLSQEPFRVGKQP